MLQFVLASKSPRRHKLLRERGYQFETISIEISEILNENLSVERAIEDLARQKAEALLNSGKLRSDISYLVLSADTVVVHAGEVLGKPKDEAKAFETLQRLSGDTHQVVTAICLWDTAESRYVLNHRVSDVEFRPLSSKEIEEYIASGDPMDKAGSYGIQSAGRQFVRKFSGHIDNIAGLPVDLVEQIMAENNWQVSQSGVAEGPVQSAE